MNERLDHVRRRVARNLDEDVAKDLKGKKFILRFLFHPLTTFFRVDAHIIANKVPENKKKNGYPQISVYRPFHQHPRRSGRGLRYIVGLHLGRSGSSLRYAIEACIFSPLPVAVYGGLRYIVVPHPLRWGFYRGPPPTAVEACLSANELIATCHPLSNRKAQVDVSIAFRRTS